MRILPDGLGDFTDQLKQKLTDSNKAVVKAYIQVTGMLAEALGSGGIGKFQKKLLTQLLPNLQDKQSLVRNDVLAATEKFVEVCGADVVLNYLIPLVAQDNPQIRGEGLDFILKYKEHINKCDVNLFTKPLVQCLQDKNPTIRGKCEEVIGVIML